MFPTDDVCQSSIAVVPEACCSCCQTLSPDDSKGVVVIEAPNGSEGVVVVEAFTSSPEGYKDICMSHLR